VFELGFHAGSGDNNVWRIDSGGGNLTQLTRGKRDHHPLCSSDSRWVYFVQEGDEEKLARVAIAGGTPEVLSELPVSGIFDLSPDSKFAAFPVLEHSGEHKEMLAVLDTASGKAARLLNFDRPRAGFLRFARDGKAVVYPTRDNGVDNLWLQPLDGSKGKLITDFSSEHIYDFHWSFDGKQLAMVRGHTDADVVLIRDTRP
jgi:Tol biopolymer transport system component